MGSNGVEQEVLFRFGCFSGFIQGWVTQRGLVSDAYHGNEETG